MSKIAALVEQVAKLEARVDGPPDRFAVMAKYLSNHHQSMAQLHSEAARERTPKSAGHTAHTLAAYHHTKAKEAHDKITEFSGRQARLGSHEGAHSLSEKAHRYSHEASQTEL